MRTWLAALLIGIIGYTAPLNPITSGSKYNHKEPNKGIVDERGFYFHALGLLRAKRNFSNPLEHQFVKEAERARADALKDPNKKRHVAQNTSVGIFGYYSGRGIHVLDVHGITDPLLARIPAIYNPNWRIGHFKRTVPKGYKETITKNKNYIADKNLARYYDKLCILTRGDLWSFDRFVEIYKMNMGYYDYLINEDRYLYPNRKRVTLEAVRKPKKAGEKWDSKNVTVLEGSGIAIDFKRKSHARAMEISLDHNDAYKIIYMLYGKKLDEQILGPIRKGAGGLVIYPVAIPAETVASKGFDGVVVIPKAGDEKYSFGHLRLLE